MINIPKKHSTYIANAIHCYIKQGGIQVAKEGVLIVDIVESGLKTSNPVQEIIIPQSED